MIILINCSNLNMGGGVQVADSICCNLNMYAQHYFIVVLSSWMRITAERIASYKNVMVREYEIKNSLSTLLIGRDAFLDNLVEQYKVSIVLTVFGPSRWIPKTDHLSGFARAHLVQRESPYLKTLPLRDRIKLQFVKWSFDRCANNYWTENPMISKQLGELFPSKRVFTITNYYNQVFDHPELWKNRILPSFFGKTFLTVTAPHGNKNLKISLNIAKELKQTYPLFRFRFVMTIDKEDFPTIPIEFEDNFLFTGKIDIAECPSLYRQSDVMFQPSLLECFTATYPEAMRMSVPIVTTDLPFARGLCEDAAEYYSAEDAADAANKLYYVANDDKCRFELIAKGHDRLKAFDTYMDRTDKLIALCERIAKGVE